MRADRIFTDVDRVEIEEHRWYALIRITYRDGRTYDLRACAEGEHSGLFLADPEYHQEP